MRSSKRGQKGVNVVESLVLEEQFKARWQQIEAHNDDGIDGLIFLEDRHENLNGKIVFVQVKRLAIKPVRGRVKVSLGFEQIARRRTAWSKVAGASILIWVDPDSDDAFWADLMSDRSYEGASVVVDLKSRFDFRSRRSLSRLCGTIGDDMAFPVVVCTREDIPLLHINQPLRGQAKLFYKSIGTVKPASDALPPVVFGRVGWQHITRPSRPVSRIFQSFTLLGAARRIVEQVRPVKVVRSLDSPKGPATYDHS